MSTKPAQITVTMVTPTKGFVSIDGHDATGTVLNDARRGEAPGSGWSTEDGSGYRVATGQRGARKAAEALARDAGIPSPFLVDIDEEYKRTGQRDDEGIREADREARAAAKAQQAAAPAAEQPAPAPAPGKAPTVVSVAKFLRTAGFQLSRYTGRMGDTPGGAQVRDSNTIGGNSGHVSVRWVESFTESNNRRLTLGLDSFNDLPENESAARRLQDYADALRPRYQVETSGRTLYLAARQDVAPSPNGVPTAAAVRRALDEAGINLSGKYRIAVVDQPDHTRIAVEAEADLDGVRQALQANGWAHQDQSPAVEHFVIHITGPAADRRERLAALKAQRAEQIAQQTQDEVSAESAAEETAERTQEQQAPADLNEGCTCRPANPTVVDSWYPSHRPSCGVWSKPEPQEPAGSPTAPQETVQRHYSRTGKAFRVGMRATYRDRSGLWEHGEIQSIEPDADGVQRVTLLADAYQAAPRRRPDKHMPNKPGKRRNHTTPRPITVALDDKDLTAEQTAQEQQ
ncbi:hypothetical protein [Streptomyces sp. cg35]|uniref:hypothetical protein n=1 Tax=Streptomyces sp. cg35 TaxID=3421650 RepID=UPI003D173EB0